MKRVILLILIFHVTHTGFAQILEYQNFDFGSTPSASLISSEEKANNKAIVLKEKSIKEILIKGDFAENYLFYYRSILINSSSILDNFNKIYVSTNGSGDLQSFKCRTIAPGGKIIEFFKGDMKVVNEDNRDYYILALEGLEEGSIIEYFYLKQIPTKYYGAEAIQSKYLIKDYTGEMILPENLFYKSKSYNGLPQLKDTSYNNKNFIHYEMKDISPAPEEKYTTNFEKYPRFEYSLDHNSNNSNKKLFTYADAAKKIITNYHEDEKGQEKLVNKLYKSLHLSGMESTDEKVFTIESYIKNDLGIIEDPGNLTMAQCVDKKGLSKFYQNKLTALLLEACGIEYEIVLTSFKDDRPFDPDFESYSLLNATLFYIPSTKKYLIMEEVFYRYGELPSNITGQKGLFVKPLKIGEVFSALNSIKYIEPMDYKKNYDYLDMDITFKPVTKKLIINTKKTYSGYSANNLRTYYFYYNETKRSELANEILLGSFEHGEPSLVKVQNFELDDFKKYELPFICSGVVETPELIETAGTDFIIKIGNCIGQQSELYQESIRKYEIYTSFPHMYKRTLNFFVPDGYTVEGLEKLKLSEELKEGDKVTAHFYSDYTVDGNKITITISEAYDKEYYSKELFEGFRKVINAAADFNKVALLLKH